MPKMQRLTIAIASLALLASACSGGDEAEASTGVATLENVSAETDEASDVTEAAETDTELAADEAALEFSACMREQGLDFPDIGVDAEGNPNLRDAFVSSGITPGSPDFAAGMEACGEILADAGFGGGGGRAALADNPEITDAFVEFSDCVRDAGYDVGDLTLGAPGAGQGAGQAQADGQVEGEGTGEGGQRGQGERQGGFGDRAERIAAQLGLDYEDPAAAETIDGCMPIIDTALSNAGVGQPGGQ